MMGWRCGRNAVSLMSGGTAWPSSGASRTV